MIIRNGWETSIFSMIVWVKIWLGLNDFVRDLILQVKDQDSFDTYENKNLNEKSKWSFNGNCIEIDINIQDNKEYL